MNKLSVKPAPSEGWAVYQQIRENRYRIIFKGTKDECDKYVKEAKYKVGTK